MRKKILDKAAEYAKAEDQRERHGVRVNFRKENMNFS
jgi:hypothetical protein